MHSATAAQQDHAGFESNLKIATKHHGIPEFGITTVGYYYPPTSTEIQDSIPNFHLIGLRDPDTNFTGCSVIVIADSSGLDLTFATRLGQTSLLGSLVFCGNGAAKLIQECGFFAHRETVAPGDSAVWVFRRKEPYTLSS